MVTTMQERPASAETPAEETAAPAAPAACNARGHAGQSPGGQSG
jgi:hypothetical protein